MSLEILHCSLLEINLNLNLIILHILNTYKYLIEI